MVMPSVLHYYLLLLCTTSSTIHGAPPNRAAISESVVEQVGAPIAVKKQPDAVAPAAHLEGVPLERDGSLNKRFHREVVLGQDADQLNVDLTGNAHRHVDTTDIDKLIVDLVKRADTNVDGLLTEEELEEAIAYNIHHHLDESIKESKDMFSIVDRDNDGTVTWDELHYHFLIDHRLMSPEQAKNHSEDDHEIINEDHVERMKIDEDEFNLADNDGRPGLNEQEYLAFRHPEHNDLMLRDMVHNIMRSLDHDDNDKLSLDEFAAPAPGEVDDNWAEDERKYLNERQREFTQLIDADGDGQATLDEMIAYMNPRNVLHAKQEVKELLTLCDNNSDGQLTLEELMEHKEQIQSSSLLRPDLRMHDDL